MEYLALRNIILDKDIDFWEKLCLDQYNALLEGSAICRAKFEKFKLNVEAVAGNQTSK